MFRKNTNERTHYSVRIITFMMLALSFLVFTIARNAVADEEDLAGRKYPRAKVYQLHKMESGYNYSESDLLKDGEMLPFKDDYDYEECIEVYSFYVGSEGSTLHIRDIFTGTDITNTEIIASRLPIYF